MPRDSSQSLRPCDIAAQGQSQVVVRLGKVRSEPQRLLQAGNGFVKLALLAENDAHVEMRSAKSALMLTASR